MKNNLKKILGIIVVIAIVVTAIILIINHFNNDGMLQTKGVSIYYKTYTDEDGWSKWSKNGVTSGDQIHAIKNIKIKVKSKDDGEVVYKLYSNGNWSKKLYSNSEIKNNKINGIELMTTDKIHRKYDIYYRIYNKDDKWLEWTFNGSISGNADKNITAIEIKIIPKDVSLEDFLNDYSKNETEYKNFNK